MTLEDSNEPERLAVVEKLEKGLRSYQEKLLQMDRRNRSVQFKKIYSKHNFDLAELDPICQKITEKMLGKKTSINILKESIAGDDADDMRGRLRKLANNLRQIEDETGQQTGYVGFPFLQGHADPDFFIRGPLVLFPATLEQRRQVKNGGWFLNFPDSRPIFNGALIAAIKKRAGIKIPEDIEEKFDNIVDDLAEYEGSEIEEYFLHRITEWAKEFIRIDESKTDMHLKKIPQLTVAKIGEMERQEFHLYNYKILGSFPQADNEIYRDYTKLLDIASSLSLGPLGDLLDVYDPDDDSANNTSDTIDLDQVKDIHLNTILDSDSSQDEVILRSKESGLVLVRGPPGTGKSQVITNLIADALSNKKKVLVVCQKRAALDVVSQRLGKEGLDKFVVMLDKEHNDRKKMYEQLYQTIQDPGHYRPESTTPLDGVSAQIDQKVETLSRLGRALHKEYFGGITVQKLYCMSRGDYMSVLDLDEAGLKVDWNGLEGYIQKMHELEPLFKRFESSENPWMGRVDFSEFGMKEKSNILRALENLKSIISGSTMASTEELQNKLHIHFETYLNRPGILKHRRKSSGKEICTILGIDSITDKYVEENLSSVQQGLIFWRRLQDLLRFFTENAGAALLQSHNTVKDFIETFGMLEESLADFEDMRKYDMKKKQADPAMKKLFNMCKTRLNLTDDWSEILRKEIISMWIDMIEKENPILKTDPAEEYLKNKTALIGLFKEKKDILKNRIRSQIARSATPRDISGKADTPRKQKWKDFAAELKRKRKTKPVRQLFERYAENFFKIAPCWLASPESVSKVFPLKRDLFDLIIVDEASQLSVERALPFLYRGRRVVIAGDEKQLQPFDLFQLREDEYDEDIPAEKSLLNMALMKHEPIQLAWHYRSHYQDLINFSNHAFYSGLLQVAPNVITDPQHPPIRWVQCTGTWDHRRNHAEAAAVLQEITMIWKKHSRTGKFPSIGVITFNDEQRDLINGQYDDMLDRNAEFYQLSIQATEGKGIDDRPFFKNIENVQGDERDIIIFSIGYAKNPDGTFTNHFGTFSMAGGENRLNVAVTRARREMVIVCSIDPTEIKETGKNLGPKRLRQFLEYSRATSKSHKDGVNDVLQRLNENMPVTNNYTMQTESPFEAQVLKELQRHGHTVHPQVGSSGYRIDLGIVHPDDPNRYVLGLECDGATFHSARSAKERDVMRQRFLEGKGWSIERIWSRNWWRNPESEMARVLARIKKEIDSTSASLSDLPKSDTDDESPGTYLPDPNDASLDPDKNNKSPNVNSPEPDINNKSPDIYFPDPDKNNKSPDVYFPNPDTPESDFHTKPVRDPKSAREEYELETIRVDTAEIDQYIASKNFASQNTVQSQTSTLTNFLKLSSLFPDDDYDQIFERFVKGKSASSRIFSKSVISGFIKFLNDTSRDSTSSTASMSKEQAQKELAKLSAQMSKNEITRKEYIKKRDELESILFD